MPSRVGVLTFHRSINYGSYWQARCLVEGLQARGHQVELLDHDCPCIQRAEYECALQPELPRQTSSAHLRSYAAKARKFDRAVAALPLSAGFPMHNPERAPPYDAIVVGSDEVWNFRHPWFGSHPIFFGDGLKAERFVSYAASFGNHRADDGIHPNWARKLDRFSSLSVRDRNSARLVEAGTGRRPATVLDPVLQFPASAATARPRDAGDYALVYGHGFPDWIQCRVRNWADARKLRLVSVGYANDWADEQRIDADPAEFAELVAGAAAVVTNFFHGCVFALVNGKPWLSSPSAYRSIKIPDLAALLGAERRLVDEHTPAAKFSELLDTPVFTDVTSRISDLREHSHAYLDAALH